MLWLALRLPLLSLEVFPQRPPPSAVVARERVLACDSCAIEDGIVPGMRLADAWALLPALNVIEHAPALEAKRLAALACWAGGFTSEVSLDVSGALLLEIAGSQRLFGGLETLLSRIIEGIAGQGHVAAAALASTPRAALWLAGSDPERTDGPRCTNLAETREALARLPLPALELVEFSADLESRLHGFGARNLGDVLRLPRAGLSRRAGAAFVTALAQALGERPDPRQRFVFPDVFCERIELPGRVEEASRLLFAAQRLIAQLCGWLSVRAAGILCCRLLLDHDGGSPSSVELSFSSATRDAGRLGRILRERLERMELSAPVVGLALVAEQCEALAGREGGLFGDAGGAQELLQLVERLQARLGVNEVHGLGIVSGHRPETASRAQAPGLTSAMHVSGQRPCWLLPDPKRLSELGGRPQYNGPLQLLAGPERIESGWWDDGEYGAVGDVRRDYYVALSPKNERLWIYRDMLGWFLHGLFA